MSQERRELLEVQPGRPPVIAPGHTFGTVTDKISSIVLNRKTPLYWFIPFAISLTLVNPLRRKMLAPIERAVPARVPAARPTRVACARQFR